MSNPDIPTSDETAPFDDSGRPSQRDHWELGASELDDDGDWQELRDRYYGLLQELRVILPGAQVLVAFLLTAPFAAGFPRLDPTNRFLFGVATVSGLLSVITLLTPTVFHRVANRRYRSARLVWGVRCAMVGLVLLGIALIAALFCVTRHIYSTPLAVVVSGFVLLTTISLWGILPRTAKPNHIPGRESAEGRGASG
jgi:Family of unknown function (DUF6328)